MKKLIIYCMLLFGMNIAATAQTLSVLEVEVIPGTTASYVLTINVGSGEYTGFQYDIQFPETGFSTPTTNKSTVNAAWSGGSINPGNLTAGTGRVSALSMGNTQIPSGDIEIGTVAFSVADDVPLGVYDATISNFEFLSATTRTSVDNLTFKVKVVSSLAVILDETSTTTPTAAEGVDVIVKRTINANEWSTICLPFAMTEEQVKTAFGDDVQLAEFMEYEVSDGGKQISVTFDNALLAQDGFMANHPYIIKVSSKIEEFTVDGVTIDPDEDNAVAEYDNGKTGSRRQVYGTFKGTYHAGTTVPNNCLFLSDNKFWYSKGNTNMKAFRGYFDFKDVLESIDGARVLLSFNDETTGIGYNKRETITNNQWYTLDGRKLDKKPAEKGLYIVNNKKVVVR